MVLNPYSFPIAGGGDGSGGGTTIITYNAVVQAQSVDKFPLTGKPNLLYIDTTASEAYYWNDTDKKYVKVTTESDAPPQEEKVFIRRASLSEWQQENPILEDGVIGYVTDDNSAKIGDGTTAWNDLPWFVQPVTPTEGLTVDDIYNAYVSGKGLSSPLNTSDGRQLITSNNDTLLYNFKLDIK